jgi:tetratricopeptide (TPR) repeat protein
MKKQEALKAYEAALVLDASDPEAQYGLGAVLLEAQGDDLQALAQAKAALSRAAATPNARAASAAALKARAEAAIAAGGMSKLEAKEAGQPRPVAAVTPPAGSSPPQLTQEMIDAVQNTERTPELEAGLAKLVEEGEEHLARGRFQEALDAYKRVVPFQPQNARARAGMAWSLVGLNRQPMADRVWQVAVSGDPKSVDSLGETLKAKGNVAGAKAVWAKLKSSSPGYAQSANLSAKLQ